ncbi:MAG: serine/threonine protein kinase [Acidobacteria bacterium]|nr:serine/threonine protein kinase [Acidobacteriota bacterium]
MKRGSFAIVPGRRALLSFLFSPQAGQLTESSRGRARLLSSDCMQIIGRYELKEKLGEGGMGVVYRAHDRLLDRIIAVKLISTPVEANSELRERFFREARAAGQLSHKNIITIHDLGEHESQPYLAMEYLEGEDLQRRLKRGVATSLSQKMALAIAACEGLEYAHIRGVVHRDVKPANIFITDSGTVKILDFGLARLITSELTRSNMMMGTLNYMAPEQVRGERADHRSDIFSMGVVLYELLCGKKAFDGDSFAATLYKILQEVPQPLLQLDATIPQELVEIVDRALAKSRDERYQHMSEMLSDLTVARDHLGIRDSPLGSRPAFTGSSTLTRLSQPASDVVPGRPDAGISSAGSYDAAASGPAAGSASERTSPAAVLLPALTPAVPPAALPSPRPRGKRGLALAAVAVAVIIAGGLLWRSFRSSSPSSSVANPPAATVATPVSAADEAEIAAAVKQAAQSLQAGDYESARRTAEGVMARASDHPEAQRIRDRAQETADGVEAGLREARAHHQAGRFDEAARAAGGVLTLAPANAEAKRVMADSSARSRGRGAEAARARMSQARAAAVAAKAPVLAAATFGTALAAEREAQRLINAGRAEDSTAKFYEASGLFHSAEVAARTEAAVAAQRAQTARMESERRPPPAPPPAAKPVGPESQTGPPSVLVGAGTQGLPAPPPVAPPAPAPPTPAVPTPSTQRTAPQEPVDVAASEQAIRDLLGRYEAALESRSLDALKRVWPGLGGAQQTAISNEFQHASRIDVDIREPRISVAGAEGTVTFVRRYELQTVEGQRLRNDTRTTMTVRRAGSGWVIDDIRFETVR